MTGSRLLYRLHLKLYASINHHDGSVNTLVQHSGAAPRVKTDTRVDVRQKTREGVAHVKDPGSDLGIGYYKYMSSPSHMEPRPPLKPDLLTAAHVTRPESKQQQDKSCDSHMEDEG